MIDLRGPCGHLYAQLDADEGVIVKKCPQCSKAAGESIYHCFDVATGRLLNGDIRTEPAPTPSGDPIAHGPCDRVTHLTRRS